MRRNVARLAAVGSALALLIAGCSSTSDDGSDAEQGEEAEPPAPESDPKADEVEDEMDEGAGPDAEEITYDDALEAIASREASFGKNDVELELNRVKVSGDIMSVLFTVTNIGDEKWQISGAFDSGEYSVTLSEDGGDEELDIGGHTADGVTVTDDENATVYRAAYDDAGHCLCSSNLSSSFVDPDKSLLLTTRFAAPPEDVETVTVQIPHFGIFDDIPLQR